ncbi:hypothetical protein [Streptosporangium vulgare]|uniref:hypothetical protein n=1 Tax=Streptosporangium vulgare TaxID=46190 RepID=UPI0031E27F2F
MVRLFTVLWGAQEPEYPGLVDTFGMDDLPRSPRSPGGTPPVLRAHRRWAPHPPGRPPARQGPRSGKPSPLRSAPWSPPPPSRRAQTPLPRTRRPQGAHRPPPREHDAPARAGTRDIRPPARARHPALERAARLRREAAARLEILHLQTQTTCAALAEIHDRMATLQAELDVHIAMRAAVRLACDDHLNRSRADRARELTVSFPAGSG